VKPLKERKKKRAASPVSEEEKSAEEEAHQDGDDDLSSIDEEFDDETSVAEVGDTATPPKADQSEIKSRRKRKRDDEDLEGKYMDRLAKEEEKEDARRAAERQSKRQKSSAEPTSGKPETNGPDTESATEMAEDKSESEEDFEVPQHESLAQTPDTEIEKANRTVFLGNVSSDVVTSKKSKKALIQHMSSFLDAMNTGGKDDKKKKDEKADEKHKFESIRFRSTAYTNMLPKKASFVTQDLMDSTTKSTNAYVVYSTQAASRAALKLNGTTVLGRHLRVDSVAHPSKSDPKRCVFVGNLGFVDDDSAIQAADAEEGKKKPRKRTPSDIEEGLWREFGKCGAVENVRVVRDSKTRIGKGIAYVQFMVS
jgi:nucleolar protein 12